MGDYGLLNASGDDPYNVFGYNYTGSNGGSGNASASVQDPSNRLNWYGQAYAAQTGYTPNQYPSYTPTQTGVGGYVGNAPLQTVSIPSYQSYSGATPTWQDYVYQKFSGTTPTYEGMMGSDYDAWQKALTTPGEIAAKTAYDQGNVNLRNVMGGQGLYGSSIMQNQARTALDTPYMNTLATNAANAAATRYGMQQTDVQNKNQFGLDIYGQQMGEQNNLNSVMGAQNLGENSFNSDIYGQKLAENQAMNQYGLNAASLGATQNQNLYNAGLTDASRQTEYNMTAADWQKQQELEQYQYQLALMGYGNQQQLTQLGLLNNANATSLAQQNTNNQNTATTISGLLNAGVSLATIYALYGGS